MVFKQLGCITTISVPLDVANFSSVAPTLFLDGPPWSVKVNAVLGGTDYTIVVIQPNNINII